MEVILKELLIKEAKEIHDMALEIGPGENGFVNSLYTTSEDMFSEKILRCHDMARGINLESYLVPQTIYWLYIDGYPSGYGKLRHYLNDKLLERGGHIGYVIRPSCRNKGYGILILRELLSKASEMKIENVLLTCDEVNMPSRKIIEANSGVLTELSEGVCKYWIKTTV
ncbi:GNAT family N-acetyltransferase [Paenibacillus glacialis]|uniref:GCN5 family acetyltransferase n=1 Tax=Paenibacillus glacialis TaxID=494026 RepID=A0A168HN76_9BACL|nr:GNAT family N-acetyltransferase [Paenibacillus glacialis]OAB38358.1 GCN5 family acetyltransferase [Paenibacillus glacialis]